MIHRAVRVSAMVAGNDDYGVNHGDIRESESKTPPPRRDCRNQMITLKTPPQSQYSLG